MTTVQQIVEAGYARSTSNDPGKLAVDLELIQHLNRKYQSVFALMAIAGGDNALAKASLVLAGSPAAAALPTDIIDIDRLENASGAKVHIVPADEKDRSWHSPPAVFRQGLSIVTLGRAGDPGVGSVLTLFHQDAPATLTALASVLDPRFLAAFEGLLIIDLAVYLSMKDDGRDDGEYTQLKSEYALLEKAFNVLVLGSDSVKERPIAVQTAGKQ